MVGLIENLKELKETSEEGRVSYRDVGDDAATMRVWGGECGGKRRPPKRSLLMAHRGLHHGAGKFPLSGHVAVFKLVARGASRNRALQTVDHRSCVSNGRGV